MKKIFLFLFIFNLSFAIEYNFFSVDGKRQGAAESSNLYEALDSLQKESKSPLLIKRNSIIKAKSSTIKNSQIQNEIIVPFSPDGDTFWVEVEKNQSLKICFDNRAIKHVNSDIIIDSLRSSCIFTKVNSNVGVTQLKITDSYQKKMTINFAVGMKILNLKNSAVKLGYNGSDYRLADGKTEDIENNRIYYDPERLVRIDALYLVDKYPVTNCEFMSLMSNEINTDTNVKDELKKNVNSFWKYRREEARNRKCEANDSAANIVYLYQALIYANKRSRAEGLEPYYVIKDSNYAWPPIFQDSSFVIVNPNGKEQKNKWIKVAVNQNSKGYRLPYYDEWIVFARGGDLKGSAAWGDSSVSVKKVLDYAWIGDTSDYRLHLSRPVGLLQPNGYGLYDMFGLVGEFVLYPGKNPFKRQGNAPSCLKGGDLKTRLRHSVNEIYIEPYWKWLNYGYGEANFGGALGGFRLVRRLK